MKTMRNVTIGLLRLSVWRAACTAAALALGASICNAQADEASRAAYANCVRGAWPTVDDAEARAAACSRALQSRSLLPDEVALARLTRGGARYTMGESIIANDDYREALKHYDSVISPRNPDAVMLYRRGAAYGGLGEADKALADFSLAIKLDPQRSRAYLDRGMLLATTSRAYQRAIDDFNRVLEIDPRNVTALVARGSALSQLDRQGEAIVDLSRAIELAPNISEARYFRGVAYQRLSDPSAALRDYDEAIRLNPHNVAALVNRAGIYSTHQRYDDAIRDLDAAISVHAANAPAFYNRGYARYAKHEYDKALADYDMAIALDPAMALAYNNRCLIRSLTGKDLVRALDDCDTALKLAPVSLEVRTTRGIVFLRLGDPRLAINEFNAALERDPNRPIALYGRGLALIAAGKPEEGRRDQASAIVLDPEVADAFAAYGLK